ncbi:helix-turn-helix domain-containing protein [Paenibacillus campinasensis]|uniref:HTH cro/C1-type domain-containing protein n=1 Tax=Paenibacillus campinasensis TaxID=66347 RepID=A0A268ELE6_9BACL|nr:LexA family transcriptional regulator [Paenibacillus campinasensis]PAD73934.1 hypothetical protein CHH67_19050 [Paenibacillus campinasensis]
MSASTEDKKMIGLRIRNLREKTGMTQQELADRIGITRHSLSNYEIGRAVPQSNVLNRLAEHLHTTTDFILGNTDDPRHSDDILIDEFNSILKLLSEDENSFKAEVFADVKNTLDKKFTVAIEEDFTYTPKEVKAIMHDDYSFFFKTELYGALMNIGIKHKIVEGMGSNNLQNQELSTVEMVKIPVYGEIRAGYGSLAQEDIIGYEVTSRDSVGDGEYFYLIVKGDSMIDEGIYEGMRVLVRKQSHCEHGKIGVVIVDGEEGTLKRVYYEDDNVVLRASNKRIPPRPYPLDEVIIQGQVTKVEFDV